MTDEIEPRAENVIEALARVIRDLPGIGKDDVSPQGYGFRGIEAITKVTQRLLAKHCVIFTPHRILNREVINLTVNGRPWTDERLTVLWRVYGPGGREDFIELEIPAIGRDNSDKGANKAMTQAFKYALLPTLCISDAKDDGDGQTHEAELPPAEPVASKQQVDEFNQRVSELEAGDQSEFVAWKADQGFPWPWPLTALHAMETKLEQIVGGVPSSEATAGDQADHAHPAPSPAGDSDEPGGQSPGTADHPAASLEEAGTPDLPLDYLNEPEGADA